MTLACTIYDLQHDITAIPQSQPCVTVVEALCCLSITEAPIGISNLTGVLTSRLMCLGLSIRR